MRNSSERGRDFRHGKRIRLLAGFFFCLLILAGWGATPVDLKISKPMIDLDVMIEDAKIGHTDKVLDTGEAADDKILGEDDDPETRIPEEEQPEPEDEKQEEQKDVSPTEGSIEDYKIEVRVRIRHTDIYLNDNLCAFRTFESELQNVQKQSGYLMDTELIDDYAEYKTYVNVRKVLDKLLIKYKETEQ